MKATRPLPAVPKALAVKRRLPLLGWPLAGATVIVLVTALFAYWKMTTSPADWLGANGASLLGAAAGGAALFFVAAGAFAQARQTRSTELLSAFELARPDLENLSRLIAINGRLVVQQYADGRPGKLAKRESDYVGGDRTSFARLFAYGKKVETSIGGSSKLKADTKKNLERQVRLYIQIFERVSSLAPSDDLKGFLFELPLGRAYCALKIASGEDPDGELLNFLKAIDPGPESEPEDESVTSA